ncbi:MAG: diphthine synthase [Candidatus Aenigmarchaeota archaeon]|nr:diphthine synthase [Candidatus Aenigmarchaeota archaeon]
MLYLIGLGIGNEGDIPVRGLEACRASDHVFLELYTARWPGSLKKLEKAVGKKINMLQRSDIEEHVSKLVNLAKKKKVSVLVAGDPLSATTHLNVLMEAKEQKVRTEVIHSSSILTAVAETGLSLYNFGRTVTVVAPAKDYAPTSFYDYAVANSNQGMHTLFLLDIDMDTSQAMEVLLMIEKEKKKKLFSSDTRLIACSGLGSGKSVIRYRMAIDLLKRPLGPPAVLILPGKMHFTEEEYLKSL